MKYSLGIDTSNYKTSIAITDSNGDIVFEKSEFLEVEQGKRGLRQSVAFFKHSNVLPLFIREALSDIDVNKITSIAVSDKPRNVEGSYMPVFLAGINSATVLSAALGVPMHTFSHQEGHIEAIMSSYPDEADEFIVFHLSGGTTECLKCKRNGNHIDAEIIGGTLDISIGQLLDRAGVKLGYSFPSGKYLDKIACNHEATIKPKKVKIRDGYFNLSGTETEVMKSIDADGDAIIPGLFAEISELLYKEAKLLSEQYGIKLVVMTGGVAASSFVRNYIDNKSENERDLEIFFGSNKLSGDNAVGIALLGGKCK